MYGAHKTIPYVVKRWSAIIGISLGCRSHTKCMAPTKLPVCHEKVDRVRFWLEQEGL